MKKVPKEMQNVTPCDGALHNGWLCLWSLHICYIKLGCGTHWLHFLVPDLKFTHLYATKIHVVRTDILQSIRHMHFSIQFNSITLHFIYIVPKQ